jgi:hypothetical protein
MMLLIAPAWLLALLAFLCAAPALAEQALDPRTVREAERTAQQIERELAQAPLTRERRAFAHCPPLGLVHERWRDASGITRRYVVDGGSDDSRVKFTHYYDRLGRLRLIVVEAGAVNGTQIRDRIVFALDGSRLSETRRRLAGPGYAWQTPWPDTFVVRNPDRAFAAQTPCGLP